MNNFAELVAMRRSMRCFTPERVTDDEVRSLLRAGLMSPSSKGMHSYEFVVVDDSETIASLSKCKTQGADFLADAPLAIVVLADPSVSDVWVEDASASAASILFQAEDLGLGACWIQVRGRNAADGQSSEQIVRSLLGIPDGRGVVCIIAVGQKGMQRKPQNEERLKWERVHFGRY